jgi:hypothetical protein
VKLIDLPRPTERGLYGRAVEKLVGTLSAEAYVDAIYQAGSVGHPGISDIDLLVVVSDDAESNANPLERLSVAQRSLFTHACFVIPVSLAPDLGRNVLLGAHRWLHGTEWSWQGDPETARCLEVQTALEFLAKNVLDLYVQLAYGMLKVRVFLQHVKGVKLDIDLVGIEADRLAVVLEDATALIDNWFERADSERRVGSMALELFPLLTEALADATASHALYAPFAEMARFAANMRLDAGDTIELRHRGVRLPRIPGLDGRKQFNALHRVNRFHFRLPMTQAPAGSFAASRFDFLRRAKTFAAERFPACSAPIPPLFYRAL